MLKNSLLIASILLSINTLAQNKKIEKILKLPEIHIGKYNHIAQSYSILLKTDFNNQKIINSKDYEKIRNSKIIKIVLYFTYYTESHNFNQKKLNRKRLKNLYKLDKKLFENPLIEWKVISQDSCKSTEEGEDYFHGFKITYIKEQIVVVAEKDISTINSILNKIDNIISSDIKIIDTSLDSIEYTVPKLDWRDFDDIFFPPHYRTYTSGHKDTAVISVLEYEVVPNG